MVNERDEIHHTYHIKTYIILHWTETYPTNTSLNNPMLCFSSHSSAVAAAAVPLRKGNLKTPALCVHRMPFDNSRYRRTRHKSSVPERIPGDLALASLHLISQ